MSTVEITTKTTIDITALEDKLKDLETEQTRLDALEIWASKLSADKRAVINIHNHSIDIANLKADIKYYKGLKNG